MLARRALAATMVLAGLALPAAAQQVESHDFEGGKLTITETASGEKQLAFDGRLIASNYMVFFDRIVDVGGKQVALVSVGDGGNACAPSTVIVWRGETEVQDDFAGGDCGAPEPSVGSYAILFVPYLHPGETNVVVQRWTPEERLHTYGRISYAPDEGSTWADLDPARIGHPLDLFRNEAVYRAARALLGPGLTDYATGLGTASPPEQVDGLIVARGCVPHACGVSDSFMAIDPAAQGAYLAQQGENGKPRTWPPLAKWPKAAREAMQAAIGGR